MKKILITGGDGQLSKQLFLELSNNFEVISLSKKDLNITDKKNVKSILSKYNPEIVINSAAYTNVDGCETNSKLAYDVNANAINNFRDFLMVFSFKYPLIMFLMVKMVLTMNLQKQIL